jgi:ABC-2 type transport system ATP-binding protein
MIQIDELVKAYDGHRAVDGLSLLVRPGEIVGLVGPNGAGKTSTLRCLAGIIPATGGRVEICGHDIVDDGVAARQQLAFVPDEPHLFDYLTVRDHMKMFARLYNVEDAAARTEQLLTDSALLDRQHDFPAELSRGMKQKLIFACALLHDPKVLVLDEPLTGLDPAAMRRVKRTVLATAEAGTAVLVSSHMLQLVEEICGRTIIINEGKKVAEGTLDEIRSAMPDLKGDANLEEIFLKATGLEDAL